MNIDKTKVMKVSRVGGSCELRVQDEQVEVVRQRSTGCSAGWLWDNGLGN